MTTSLRSFTKRRQARTSLNEISVSAMRIPFTFGSATIKFSSKQICPWREALRFDWQIDYRTTLNAKR
ncbi:hypothetical protein T05_14079 [Trichinella murrelli]|uniref:Uncharacterized protein n=1 Tax=Trichinella murrelli TaxID=144512 RepID=A0A0V0TCZ5_9BILA|nr:hypothetical protein T05_14079 [Trichinella murrelli]